MKERVFQWYSDNLHGLHNNIKSINELKRITSTQEEIKINVEQLAN